MRKSTRIVKRTLALFLVVLMSINSFGTVVSDNDGSAFITKAEFDSLKNNFQSQIDQYNTSIDSKIDGAIASYLAGINIAKKTTEQFFDGKGAKVLVADMCKINDLNWGKIGIRADISSTNFPAWQEKETPKVSSAATIQFQLNRSPSGAFEIFRYNKANRKLIDYASDFNGTFTTTNIRINVAAWTVSGEFPNPLKFRWHASGNVKGTKITEFKDTFDNRPNYNVWLASPNWLFMYGTWVNISAGWTLEGPGSYNDFWCSSISSWKTTSETPIKMVFADDSGDLSNKLWTSAGDEDSGIDIKYLKADYNSDTTQFAINYNKTGRTLEYNLPSDAGVQISNIVTAGINIRPTENQSLPFAANETVAGAWTDTGTTAVGSVDQDMAENWWEPYFENDSHYSKNIINNIDNSQISEFSSYGFTGALTEGIPIGLFKEDDECEFELNLPYAMSVGLRTNVFTAGTVVLNTSNDANLEVTIDNVKKTNSNNEVAAGNHKFKIKYVGSGSKPIFIKIGRANADLSTTYRYIVTLPTEYTKTTT